MWELEVEDRTAYLPGIGIVESPRPWPGGACEAREVMYTHSDQIGSVRAVTTCAVGAGNCVPGETATVLQRPVYTAFGELVYDLAPQDTHIRYRYAGDWGYEGRLGSETNGGSDAASGLPYTHVGHRWYDPATGRFLQRDPIGMRGGLHTYAYADFDPVRQVDPLGLMYPHGGLEMMHLYNGYRERGYSPEEASQALSGHRPSDPVTDAKDFLNATGGACPTFLDYWGDGIGARIDEIITAIGAGFVAACRVPKRMSIPDQAPTTSGWRSLLLRAGHGKAGIWAARAGYAGFIAADVYVTYLIIDEGRKAWRKAHPR